MMVKILTKVITAARMSRIVIVMYLIQERLIEKSFWSRKQVQKVDYLKESMKLKGNFQKGEF